MGKSSKKSNVEAAPVSVLEEKPGKKGKRGAVEANEKLVSAKKQKKEVQPVVPKKVEDGKKPKKALQQPPPRKKPETSSSEDITASESEEEEIAKKPAAPVRKMPPMATSNGSKKGKLESGSESEYDEDEDKAEESSDEASEESSDESDEETQKQKLKETVSSNAGKPAFNAVQEETGSEEDDGSEETSDDEPESAEPNKPSMASKRSSSSKEDSSEEESEEEREDELPAKTPKKDTDVKMVDAPSANKAEKQAYAKSEKKAPKTPAANQSQPSGSKTLFVGNMSFNAGEDDVAEFFKDAGEVVQVRLASFGDGKFRGFGHVEFATVEAAQKALELNGQELLGRAVKLDLAREKGEYTPQSGKENASQQKGGKGQSQTIFVKGFDKDVDEDEIRSSLEEHFGSCGEITRVSVPTDRESGACKGIAYLDFSDQDGFSKALELNGSELGGYALTVDEAKPKGDGRDGGWSGGRDSGGRGGGRFGGRRGGGRGGRGGGGRGRGGGGRGRGGTPSGGKKTKFGDY